MTTLYLFQSSSSGLTFAVAVDKTGADIPKLKGDAGWLLRSEVDADKLSPDVVQTAMTRGYCFLESDEVPDE